MDSDRVHLGVDESIRNIETALQCLNMFSINMADNEMFEKDTGQGQTVSRAMIIEMLNKKSYIVFAGDLNCPTCTLIRGALVGVVGGGIYPILLALPVNAGLAARYNSAPMPEKGNMIRFWTNLSKPVVRKMYVVLLLQGLFGTYLSSKQFDIYLKMLKIPDSDSEELNG
ncbi:transmembrane protein 126A [Labeo rohita]|uniref:Transmembrane protein 126A n=1 Tax=Labeo rohita TaxID=84645 RepID=A0A498LUG4_LABRO|nr:transmembrane protein 126A [Labeo rohita]